MQPRHKVFLVFLAALAGVLLVWWQGQIAPGDIGLQSTIDLLIVAVIATKPEAALMALAYAYLSSAFIEWGITRWRARRDGRPAASS